MKMNPVVYQVFNTWELVEKIFSYLPWHLTFRLSHLTDETLAYFRNRTREIDFDDDYDLSDDDYFDIFKLLGKEGCERLVRIDFRECTDLTRKVTPILKYCKNLRKLGCTKWKKNTRFYFHLLYNQDIEEFKVNSIEPKYFCDTDVMELHLLLPNLQRLEIPHTNITNTALYEIAEWHNTLKYLNISHCERITEYGVRQIFKKCTRLEGIDLRNTPTLEESYLALINHNKTLKYLSARETYLTREGASAIATWFETRNIEYEFIRNHYLPRHSSVNDVIRQRIREEFERVYGVDDSSSDSDEDFDVADFCEATEVLDCNEPPSFRRKCYDTIKKLRYSKHNNNKKNIRNLRSREIEWDSQIFERENNNESTETSNLTNQLRSEHSPFEAFRMPIEIRNIEIDGAIVHRVNINDEIQHVWRSIDRAGETLRSIERQFDRILDGIERDFNRED